MDEIPNDDIIILKNVQKLFFIDNNEICLGGSFVQAVTVSMAISSPSSMQKKAINALQQINMDIWNLCKVVDRIEWFRNYVISENIDKTKPFVWSEYTSIDIEFFFIQIRSILDYVASVINALAVKHGTIPESFNELYKKLIKDPPECEPKLGLRLSSIVKSASWYEEIRDIRDNLVHFGSDTFVFGRPEDGILFQVMHKLKGSISIEKLMWNENVVDFQLYAALYFSRLLTLLEQLANVILAQWNPRSYYNAWINLSGLSILSRWIDRLIGILESTNSQLA